MIDKVQIDLKRYGVPTIDQHKIPIPPQKGPVEKVAEDVKDRAKAKAKPDSVSASRRILSKPPPGRKPRRSGS